MKCPICNNKNFKYVSYSEGFWGIVEQHGHCDRCGYTVEQAYSPSVEFFSDIIKGYYNKYNNLYYQKDIKKHKRYRRLNKDKIHNIPINPYWSKYI